MGETRGPDRPANRLAGESSPYLRQHAHNPVDWHPWGEEALRLARQLDRPVFLSVGYSACHWCHVMERESFEDPETARLLNEHFVNVKVDREERPDIDAVYMQAVQAMTGHGGWPMSVWLTLEGAPFHGGTYFPPTERHGMPSFRRVLEAVAEAWRTRRREVEGSAAELREAMQRGMALGRQPGGRLDESVASSAVAGMARAYDPAHGGFGGAPKFPQASTLGFLLRHHARTGDEQALEMATHTLRQIVRGGIHDQLGGGFHRYSTDARWLVPHFEKMLYDNAMLAQLLLEAWQVTGEHELRRAAEGALDYLLREMADPSGAFSSSEDADSEGEEGRFFVWEPRELEEVLGAGDARLVGAFFGVTPAGHLEGRSVLHVAGEVAEVAARLGVGEQEVRDALQRARPRLLAARERRARPGRDEKVLAEWNGMALRALALAAGALDRPDYRAAAERLGAFLTRELLRPDGRLLRCWAPPSLTGGAPRASVDGFLADHAQVADGLLELYQLTFEPRWLEAARLVADTVLERFLDGGTFFETASHHERLVARPRSLTDNAVPSGGSVATEVLLKLAALTGKGRYRDAATSVLGRLAGAMARHPLAFSHLLCALERLLSRPLEVVVIGDPTDTRTRALLAEVRSCLLPGAVLAGAPDDEAAARAADRAPLLAGRVALDGAPAAYVCAGGTCELPVTDPGALARLLDTSAR